MVESLPMIDLSEHQIRTSMIRLKRDRLLTIRDSSIALSFCCLRTRSIAVDQHSALRGDGQRGIVVLNRLVEFAHRKIFSGSIAIRIAVIGFQLYCFGQVCHRLGVIPSSPVEQRPCSVGLSDVRIQAESRRNVLHGLIISAYVTKRISSVDKRLDTLGIVSNRVAVVIDSLQMLAYRSIGIASIVVCLIILWIQLNQPIIDFYGLRISVLLQILECLVAVR